jgi:hypothetical protein
MGDAGLAIIVETMGMSELIRRLVFRLFSWMDSVYGRLLTFLSP